MSGWPDYFVGRWAIKAPEPSGMRPALRVVVRLAVEIGHRRSDLKWPVSTGAARRFVAVEHDFGHLSGWWPIKPDILFKGGKAATDGGMFDNAMPDLCLSSTYYKPAQKAFVLSWATSSATAQVARIAAAGSENGCLGRGGDDAGTPGV